MKYSVEETASTTFGVLNLDPNKCSLVVKFLLSQSQRTTHLENTFLASGGIPA